MGVGPLVTLGFGGSGSIGLVTTLGFLSGDFIPSNSIELSVFITTLKALTMFGTQTKEENVFINQTTDINVTGA